MHSQLAFATGGTAFLETPARSIGGAGESPRDVDCFDASVAHDASVMMETDRHRAAPSLPRARLLAAGSQKSAMAARLKGGMPAMAAPSATVATVLVVPDDEQSSAAPPRTSNFGLLWTVAAGYFRRRQSRKSLNFLQHGEPSGYFSSSAGCATQRKTRDPFKQLFGLRLAFVAVLMVLDDPPSSTFSTLTFGEPFRGAAPFFRGGPSDRRPVLDKSLVLLSREPPSNAHSPAASPLLR